VISLAVAGCSSEAQSVAAEPSLLAMNRYGTAGDDFARSIAAAPDGALWVTGYTDGAFEGAENGGAWDAFLTRVSADGSPAWSRQWGGAGPEFAQGLAVDPDGRAYVAGYSPGGERDQPVLGGHDAFLTSFESSGERGWSTRWGTDADDYVYAAALAPGGVVVVGYTQGAFDGFENAGGADAFVSLCNTEGDVVWTQQLGTAGTDYAQAVTVDASGRILVTGYTAGRLGYDPDLGAEDAFLLELTGAGEMGWLHQWGSETTDYALSVAVDADGDAYVTGYTYGAMPGQEPAGGEDAYLSKLSHAGELLWTRQLGTVSRDSGRFVLLDPSGDPIVIGDTEGSLGGVAAGRRDAFWVHLDPQGHELQREQWGVGDSELSLSAARVGSTFFVAGYVEGAADARDALLSTWSF
jgi:hypothetical protein